MVVDSRSGGLSNGTTWAEQTYGSAGAYCADGAGGTSAKASAGACIGGRRGDQSDNLPASLSASNLQNAEHIIGVTLASTSSADNDVGFSYNIVTGVADGDDDGSAARSIQGSLRQFMQNANVIGGANAMRFVPAVPLNESNWWNITVGSILPELTDPETALDGTAYNFRDGVSPRNTNTGSVDTGGMVGVDAIAFNQFERKELEINLADQGDNALQLNTTGAAIVRNVAIYNNSIALSVLQVSGGVIEDTFLGTRADGTDPGGNLRGGFGINFTGNFAASTTIQNNYTAFLTIHGITSSNNNAGGQIRGNEIYKTALTNSYGDGVDVVGTWTFEQNLLHENGSSSFVRPERAGAGIEVGRGSNVVSGINLLNEASNSIIEKNIIYNNGTNYASAEPKLGAGIKLTIPNNKDITGNKISQNSIYGNHGLGIDIVTDYSGGSYEGKADGVTPNDGATASPPTDEPNSGIDYPVVTEVTVNGNILHLEGYVGTASSPIAATHTIELFKANDDGNNNGEIEAGDGQNVPHGEGETYLQNFTTNPDGTFDANVTVTDVVIGDLLTATATDPNNNTSEFSANSQVEEVGVSVSGTVYSDASHSGTRESGESGIEVVTVVLHNTSADTCQSTQTDAAGDYLFEEVPVGDYEIIEAAGEATPMPGSCPASESDLPGYVSSTSNTLAISVTGAPITEQNFGDFNGSNLTGTVFADDGAGAGTANDGLQNGEETGIAGATVRLTDIEGSTVHSQTQTTGDGRYTLWIPDGLSGSPLGVEETNVDSDVSTGGQPGTTGGSYDRAADATFFTPASGVGYNDVNFGDVQNNSLNTDGQQNTTAGTTVFFPHTFTARTTGELTFSTIKAANPVNTGWSQVIYQDNNCNGTVDSGEQMADTPISVMAGQQVCMVVGANTPAGVSAGSSNAITVTADFGYTNATPALSGQYTRVDLVTITDAGGSGLKITKQVDREQALPGQTLTYTISYTNNSSEPLNDLEIDDSSPAFTTFSSAGCGTLPDNLSNCSIDAPSSDAQGSITWTFIGSLRPGATGEVTYEVTIRE